MKKSFYSIILGLCASLCASSLSAQTWERSGIDFDALSERARELAGAPYTPPPSENIPQWMKDLSYDDYRDIRFRPDRALWRKEGLPFQMMLFHPGYLFREPVVMHEVTSIYSQLVRFSPDYFDYGTRRKHPVQDTPTNAGYAGFRLHYRLNNPDYFDELIVFQGASYWRALGAGQRYGISARGLAINTGSDGVPEEFPIFREVWVRKPEKDAKSVTLYALLDGPSVSGAYELVVTPGDDTLVDVKTNVFIRKPIKRLGIAPMSSMFWFGENSRRRFDDHRPEVHDSDGLAIRLASGERIWRPIANDTNQLDFSFFGTTNPKGFGLVQRDRSFSSYEDTEAAYHLRPTLWIEPTSDWGFGHIMLMEIPTANELADNTVALWEPHMLLQSGQSVSCSYRQYWTRNGNPSNAGGRVVATRTGVHEWAPNNRIVIVEFAGGNLDNLPPDTKLEGIVEAHALREQNVKVRNINIQCLPDKRWRLSFELVPAVEEQKLSDIGPVEMRACLRNGDNYLTETWAYRIKP